MVIQVEVVMALVVQEEHMLLNMKVVGITMVMEVPEELQII